LITGGTGRVGLCLVEGFAQAGWEVVLTSRQRERAEAVALDIQRSTGCMVHAVVAEFDSLASPNATARLVDNLRQQDLLPSCLVNNARNITNLGVDEYGRPSAAGWREEFFLDVVVAHKLTMDLVSWSESTLRSVVNVGSMYGVVAPNLSLYNDPVQGSPIHYGVCKAALIHLTKELAVRLSGVPIRVNAISYGGIEGRADQEFATRYGNLCPQGRMLDDADIAGPAVFLASEEAASGITGHNLVVDGGWSIW